MSATTATNPGAPAEAPQGAHQEGIPDGSVERRDETGATVERATFRGGVLHGPTTLFGPDGLASTEISFAEGVRDGPMTVYDTDGTDLARLTYRAGVLEGPAVLYSAGRVVTELSYVAGLAEGPMRSFAASGVLGSAGMLRQGRLHG